VINRRLDTLQYSIIYSVLALSASMVGVLVAIIVSQS
jgi:hypothetical protein